MRFQCWAFARSNVVSPGLDCIGAKLKFLHPRVGTTRFRFDSNLGKLQTVVFSNPTLTVVAPIADTVIPGLLQAFSIFVDVLGPCKWCFIQPDVDGFRMGRLRYLHPMVVASMRAANFGKLQNVV